MLTEFGGDLTGGAVQPDHLHAGLWGGLAAGSSILPLLWTDGGGYPLFTDATHGPAMRAEYSRISAFMGTMPWVSDAGVGEALVTVSDGSWRTWGMQAPDRGFVWIEHPSGSIIAGRTISIAGCQAGTYRLAWHDPWNASAVPVSFGAPVTVGSGGALVAPVPVSAKPDTAGRFWRNAAPAALAQTVTVSGTTPVLLTGSDADGDPLGFVVVMPPGHGTLSGSPPSLT